MSTTAEELRRFLDAASYREARRRESQETASRPFVTISRQAGAGGHTLAGVLINAMQREPDPLFRGWQMLDRELCEKLTQDATLRVTMRSLLAEEYRSQTEDVVLSLLAGATPQYLVIKKTCEIIRAMASVGRVIIVGRGGVCTTRHLPGGVHLRLVASEAFRVRRMQQRFCLSEDEARTMVRTQDRGRARLVREHFFRDIDDPLLYDATWNTETTSCEAIAAATIALIIQRMPERPRENSEASAGISLPAKCDRVRRV